MNAIPTVSVLLPTFNHAQYLDDSIQSVLNQTYPDFELIIVDNNSTDNTWEVVEKYLGDKRVRFYQNETDLGLTGNWNKCLTYATGKYIKYICSDDIFHPELLARYVAVMGENPTVSLVTCFKEEFGLLARCVFTPVTGLLNGKEVIYNILREYNWCGEPTLVMFRKSDLQVGEFRNFTWITDWEMWFRLLAIGDCYIVPEVLCYIRNHPQQVTKMADKNCISYFEEYTLCKAIRDKNEYGLDLTRIDINQVIRAKAAVCAKAIPAFITTLYLRQNRLILLEALKIIYTERVITLSIAIYKNKMLRQYHSLNQFARYFKTPAST